MQTTTMRVKSDASDAALALVDQFQPQESEESIASKQKAALLEVLDRLGGLSVGDDAIQFAGSKFILPEFMAGKNGIAEAIKYLQNYEKSQETEYEFNKIFPYRPLDGAHAFQNVLRKLYGSTGIGVKQVSFFGTRLPQMITIDVGYGKTTQVPWEEVEFSPLEASFYIMGSKDREKGELFYLGVRAPRKNQKRVEALYALVEEELRTNSIYRGQALNAAMRPEFIDVTYLNPETVVYSKKVFDQLEANVWSMLRYADQYRALGIPLKRAILFEGQHGTGKTLAGVLTAQQAVKAGWTFILVRPGKDDVLDALATAQLYAPAVVWCEDIDQVASDGTTQHISRVLDALDSITTKGHDIITGFTTNHVGQLQKGVLRPGRLDAVISINELDPAAFQKLILMTLDSKLVGEIDFDAVAAAMKGFLPSFVVEAVRRAVRYGLVRGEGVPQPLVTRDLVLAAEDLAPQLELHSGARVGPQAATVDSVFRELVKGVVTGDNGKVVLVDEDGDPIHNGAYLSAEVD